MKTNHRRNFVAKYYDFRNGIYWCSKPRRLLSGAKVSAGVESNDFVCGVHGYARQRRGSKNRVNSLDRNDAKKYIRDLMSDIYTGDY